MRKISEILCCVAILCCALSACSDKPATVKVSSFNIWLNTLGGKLPPSQTAKVIEASQTDIVGISMKKTASSTIMCRKSRNP